MTTLLAYLEIALFLFTEGRLRTGEAAKSLEQGAFDQNSTRRIGQAFFTAGMALLAAPLLNWIGVGRLSAPVTVPQMRALAILTLPENLPGMTIKDLTRAMGLSQSTVSGIVDRLERMMLVRRLADAQDKRRSRIEAAHEVKTYVQKEVIEQRLSALAYALGRTSAAERAMILSALETLERLLVNDKGRNDNLTGIS